MLMNERTEVHIPCFFTGVSQGNDAIMFWGDDEGVDALIVHHGGAGSKAILFMDVVGFGRKLVIPEELSVGCVDAKEHPRLAIVTCAGKKDFVFPEDG